MRFPSIAAIAALTASFVACSSNQGGSTTDTGGDNGGIDGTAQVTGHDSNPQGVAYPVKNIGTHARGVDGAGNVAKKPGNVMQNFKFLGYPNGDKSKGLQTVALADYFDPTGTKYKVVHLVVAGVWCNPCNQETDALVSSLADPSQSFDKKGVAYIQALDDGPVQGTGATKTDLDGWIVRHKTTFTEVLDPNNANLGAFFDAAAIPWNADLDARTMEILQAGVGYEEPTAVQQWIDWVDSNPPSQF